MVYYTRVAGIASLDSNTIKHPIARYFLLFFLLLLATAGNASETRIRRHIVLIVADAMRYDVAGCYGGSAHTPNIDWLAQNGVTFTRAYSAGTCTQASSVALFTGNHIADPHETTDLAPLQPQRVKSLAAEIRRVNREVRRRRLINVERLPGQLDLRRKQEALRSLGYIN